MGGREAGSRCKEPLGNRVTVGHKASAAVGLRAGALVAADMGGHCKHGIAPVQGV